MNKHVVALVEVDKVDGDIVAVVNVMQHDVVGDNNPHHGLELFDLESKLHRAPSDYHRMEEDVYPIHRRCSEEKMPYGRLAVVECVLQAQCSDDQTKIVVVVVVVDGVDVHYCQQSVRHY